MPACSSDSYHAQPIDPAEFLEHAMSMMAHLHGVVVAKTVERVVVDVHGVGYQVVVPLSTYYALPDLQERTTLLTTMYVRADTLRLYGFATPDEQEVFERLISVASVGPRLALNMLSSLSA